MEAVDWALPSHNGDFPSGVWSGSSPSWQIYPIFHASSLKTFHESKEFEREERPHSSMVIDGEEEYEAEAILKHKGKGGQCLHVVMWKEYSISESSWESKLHPPNAPLILEDYLHYDKVED